MSSVLALSDAILDRFWHVSAEGGAPLATELRRDPDLSAVASEADRMGLTLPPEIRTLWLHGAAPMMGTSPTRGVYEITSQFSLLSPEDAIAATQRHRDEGTPKVPFPNSWLIFAQATPLDALVVDCTQHGPASPVFQTYGEDPGGFLVSHSLGALFDLWTKQIISGELTFDGGSWWEEDHARHPVFTPEELS